MTPETKIQDTSAAISLGQMSVTEIIHELQAQQLRLEKQNEELIKTQYLLQESRDRYQDLYDFAPVGYFTLTESGTIFDVNLTGAAMLGIPRLKLKNSAFRSFIVPDWYDPWDTFFQSLVYKRKKDSGELKLIREGRSDIFCHIDGLHTKRGEKQPVIRLAVTDITLQQRREEELRIFAELIDNAPSSITVHNYDGTFLYVNQKTLDLHGFSHDEYMAKNLHEIDVPGSEKQIESRMDQLKRSGENSFEVEHFRKDGSSFPLQVNCRTGEWDGKPIIFSIATDLSALKRTEKALRKTLAEREVLLREVHHRVKNNLASIIGLISLQQNALSLNPVEKVLSDLKERIRSMALVHEMLCRAGSLERVDFQGYLNALLPQLIAASDNGVPVLLTMDAPDVTMTLDSAIPCSLIVNELVTNSLKYAFPDGVAGDGTPSCTVSVKVSHIGPEYHLIVRDNGIGLPEEFTRETPSSVGIRLIRLLTQHQLGGVVQYTSQKGTGTECSIQFTDIQGGEVIHGSGKNTDCRG